MTCTDLVRFLWGTVFPLAVKFVHFGAREGTLWRDDFCVQIWWWAQHIHRALCFLGFLSFYPGKIGDSAKSDMFIAHDGGVQILCKYPETVRQFKMQLLKGMQPLCNLTRMEESGNTVSVKNLQLCQSQLSNSSVSFFLYNLDRSHASYYSCKLLIFDPPPFQEIVSTEYLHIYGKMLFAFARLNSTYAFWQFPHQWK